MKRITTLKKAKRDLNNKKTQHIISCIYSSHILNTIIIIIIFMVDAKIKNPILEFSRRMKIRMKKKKSSNFMVILKKLLKLNQFDRRKFLRIIGDVKTFT
jgi:hypothetical protein